MVIIILGAASLSAQFQLPKKAPSKQEQILKENNKDAIKGPKLIKGTAKQYFDIKAKSLRDRGIITRTVGGVTKTIKSANASFKPKIKIGDKIVKTIKKRCFKSALLLII